MRRIIASICLGLPLWLDPAGAQNSGAPKVYSLTVSVHKDVQADPDTKLTKQKVQKILKGASALLKNCNVKFKLNGPVKTFSSAPAVIRDERDRDAVYAVQADVKVVKDVKFCHPDLAAPFNGCAYPFKKGRDSMIVTHIRATTDMLRSILWAHEFGHRTGLHHRPEADAIMSGCQLVGFQDKVSRHECGCYFKGPGGCPPARSVNQRVCGPDQ